MRNQHGSHNFDEYTDLVPSLSDEEIRIAQLCDCEHGLVSCYSILYVFNLFANGATFVYISMSVLNI